MIDNFKDQIINGVQFQRAANYIVGPDIRDTFKSSDKVQVIWCRPDYIDLVFEQCRNTEGKFILITHCSDIEINEEYFKRKPSNIIKWFAQNISYSHPDLHCIPIGLESHRGPYRGDYTNFEWLFNNIKPEPISNKIINKIYCNFSLNTNKKRIQILHSLYNHDMCIHEQGKNYIDYCSSVKQFLFIASPRGNGIDCHRTWEALYLGSIPIVEKSYCLDSLIDGLPVIAINDWNDKEELKSKMNEYVELYKKGEAFKNVDKLKIDYWLEKIRKEVN